MSGSEPFEVALRFNHCINRRSIAGLGRLMTDDHVFIDAESHTVEGKESSLVAWTGFSDAFPDYRNVSDNLVTEQDIVTVIGQSICSDERLKGPAIWKTKTRGNKVAEWRVYDDTREIRQQLGI